MGSAFSSQVPKVFWAHNSAHVPVNSRAKTADATDGRRTIRDLVQEFCPSLFTPYAPPWWLIGGHMQTLYSVLGDFSKVDKVVYDRTLLRLKDGGTIGLDFTLPAATGRIFTETTPVVVVLHGLTGGSHESYVRAVVVPAITPVTEGGLGYRAVVVNFRACAGVPLTSPQLYSAAQTDDLRQALLYIAELYPNAPLVGLGFSLGASILTRYLAQEGEESRLSSGCALGTPWDYLKMNDRSVPSNMFLHEVYAKGLGSNCQKLLATHAAEISKFPDSYLASVASEVISRKSITAIEFDTVITRVVGGPAPLFPFNHVLDFYSHVCVNKLLPDIRVPFLGINSDDDPIANDIPMDNSNKWVTIAATVAGGHLGWFETEGGPFGNIRRWVRKPVLEWLKVTAEDMAPDHRKPREIFTEDGWLMQVGRDDLGVRVVKTGTVVEGVAGEGGLLAGL
ncbi:AB-hydrolase YheT [Amylostereum chailletii]|nr:AB-hydrolase YheT [Amylostereum chailletii]